MVPSGSLEALPSTVMLLVGSVIEALLPALATGAWFAGAGGVGAGGVGVATAGFTVTVTLALDEVPLLSVTVSVNV